MPVKYLRHATGPGLDARGFGRHPRDGRVKHIQTADRGLRSFEQEIDTANELGTPFDSLAAWVRDGVLVQVMREHLATLPAPTATRILAQAIAEELGTTVGKVSSFLMGVAPVVPEAMRAHSKAFSNAKGEACVPWVWYPTPRVGPAPAPVVEEWTAPAASATDEAYERDRLAFLANLPDPED